MIKLALTLAGMIGTATAAPNVRSTPPKLSLLPPAAARLPHGVAMDQGRAESMTRTAMLGISVKIQEQLQLTTAPTYKGTAEPTVYIRGFRKDGKTGAPILSLAGEDVAFTYWSAPSWITPDSPTPGFLSSLLGARRTGT